MRSCIAWPLTTCGLQLRSVLLRRLRRAKLDAKGNASKSSLGPPFALVPVGTDNDKPAASYACAQAEHASTSPKTTVGPQSEPTRIPVLATACVEEEPTDSRRSFGSVSSPLRSAAAAHHGDS